VDGCDGRVVCGESRSRVGDTRRERGEPLRVLEYAPVEWRVFDSGVGGVGSAEECGSQNSVECGQAACVVSLRIESIYSM
jgi:hypothetical protein